MSQIKSLFGIMVTGLVFSVGFNVLMTNDAYAAPPPTCFLNVDASDNTCWTHPNDFLDGTGVAKCTVARNGNVNCTCKGDLASFVPTPHEAIIGNKDDLCCITGVTHHTIVTENNHSNVTPSRRLHFQCHANANQLPPAPW